MEILFELLVGVIASVIGGLIVIAIQRAVTRGKEKRLPRTKERR